LPAGWSGAVKVVGRFKRPALLPAERKAEAGPWPGLADVKVRVKSPEGHDFNSLQEAINHVRVSVGGCIGGNVGTSGEELYLVHSVLAQRVCRSKRQVLVHWKGWRREQVLSLSVSVSLPLCLSLSDLCLSACLSICMSVCPLSLQATWEPAENVPQYFVDKFLNGGELAADGGRDSDYPAIITMDILDEPADSVKLESDIKDSVKRGTEDGAAHLESVWKRLGLYSNVGRVTLSDWEAMKDILVIPHSWCRVCACTRSNDWQVSSCA
jgi:hypothetical protein